VNAQEQAKLLRWARANITAAVRGEPPPIFPDSELTPALCVPQGAFVTLKKHGELRGCIGFMDWSRPLWVNVARAAVAAALEDSRFEPVTPEELPAVRVEISVLTPPVDLPDLALFDPQRHGIIVEEGFRRALLLPKVAQEYGWGAAEVLSCVCRKAGLPADAWERPGPRFQVFTAVDFGEGKAEDAGAD
jgi:AmmeMemoRadiSam system protein A